MKKALSALLVLISTSAAGGAVESKIVGSGQGIFQFEKDPSGNTELAQLILPNSIFTQYKPKKKQESGSNETRERIIPGSIQFPTGQSSPQKNNTTYTYIPPQTLQKARQTGFDPNTINVLKNLGQKAKSGNASQSEIEELKKLCDVATEFNKKSSTNKKFDRSKTDKGVYDRDRGTDQEETWDKDKKKKVKVKGEGSGLTLSGSASTNTDFSESNKGSRKDRKSNTSKGEYDRSSNNTYETSSDNELNREAQSECGAVVEFMATKDTNQSNERIQQMKNQDAMQQRQHELEMKRMELESINRSKESDQQNQQQNMWMQMGGAVLNNLLAPKPTSPQVENNQGELMDTIKRQQEQIDQLLKMQQAKPAQ